MNLRLLTIALLLVSAITRADNRQLLTELDNTIAQRGQYVKEKERRITDLKRQTVTAIDHAELLRLYNDLYQEYYVFQFDSARAYAEKGHLLAQKAGHVRYQTLFQLYQTEILTIGGLYGEAQDVLGSIDPAKVDSAQLFKYYFTQFLLYSYKATFTNDTIYKPQYTLDARQCLIDAMRHLSPSNPSYDYLMGEKSVYIDKDDRKAREHYLKVVEKQPETSRTYAMACFALAGNYYAEGDMEKYQEYLIRSSLSDLKSATKENSALQNLAIYLFGEGKQHLERAQLYINTSMDDAKFYNSRLRMIEVSRALPQIMSSYQSTVEQQNKRLSYALVFISLLVIGLAIALYLIFRQNRLLTARRKELARSNEQLTGLNDQLHALNGQLVDTNKKRESLASIYIDLCAKYIDKLGKYQTLVKRKIKAHQEQELLQSISSTRISEEDAATFLNRFDKAFLELYPSFVDEFNALLQPEARIQQKSPSTLTTELRTYALIRLGVKNTADIAGLLFLSTQTIYNCRSVIKNRAINKDTFDEDVQKICVVIK